MDEQKDFDLLIERFGESWRAKVISSPFGEATHQFKFPFPIGDLQSISTHVRGEAREIEGINKLPRGAVTAVEQFGAELFNTVFDQEVGNAFRFSVEAAKRESFELRLRLRLGNSELSQLPWEYLYDSSGTGFIALSGIPIIRHVELPQPVRGLRVQLPLQVLVVAASPKDEQTLNIEDEWKLLKESLNELEERNALKLTRLEKPTFDALAAKLSGRQVKKSSSQLSKFISPISKLIPPIFGLILNKVNILGLKKGASSRIKNQYHILHFIGHGSLNKESGQGNLIFEKEDGNSDMVTSEQLGYILGNHNSLKLVFLNSCKGASFKGDPFASVARTLVRRNIPAVVAMQFRITDDSAIILAQRFYQALAEDDDTDTALAIARKAVYIRQKEEKNFEWGTPVLFMRSADGQVNVGIVPRPRLVYSALALVGIGILTFVILALLPPKLPDVVGKSLEDAKRTLEQECRLSILRCFKVQDELEIDKDKVAGSVIKMYPAAGESIRRGKEVKLTVSAGSVEIFHYFYLYKPSRDPSEITSLIPELITTGNSFLIKNDLYQSTENQKGAGEPVLYTWLFMKNTGLEAKCVEIELVHTYYNSQLILITNKSPSLDSRSPLFPLPRLIGKEIWTFLVHREESDRPDVFDIAPPKNLSFKVDLALSKDASCNEPFTKLPLQSTEIDISSLLGGNK